jgi:hypothetical protein
MACPTCGGERRTELASGLFQCSTPLPDTDHISLGPRIPCGTRYTEGPVDAPCILCGLDAFTRCLRCTDAVCGMHMRLGPDGLECSRCYQQRIS